MGYDGVKVTTEDGCECTFSYNEEERTISVLFFNGTAYFRNEVVDGSINELTKGAPLVLRYYAGMGTELYMSKTPIASIEIIEKN